jgi:tRNA threonylcarbamoyladenosine biosynthesis protein TsaE
MATVSTFICSAPEGLEEVARAILDAAGNRRTVCLEGDLGAGKTALVSAFARVLGSADEASSPTFAIVQEYLAPGLSPPLIRHIDAYRLRDAAEVEEAGIPEYLDDAAWTFVEWPELLSPWLPDHRVELRIAILPDSSREIVFSLL